MPYLKQMIITLSQIGRISLERLRYLGVCMCLTLVFNLECSSNRYIGIDSREGTILISAVNGCSMLEL